MRIAIVGSRNFSPLSLVREYIRALPKGTVIISGGAIGVDLCARLNAHLCDFRLIEFLPNWKKYGRRAGAIRNQLIVDEADRVVAFWDGSSKGTQITVNMAKKAGKEVELIVRNPKNAV